MNQEEKKRQKRVLALFEIFTSEKSYLEDLLLWGKEFREMVAGSEAISQHKKKEVMDVVLMNISEIYDLHHGMYGDMCAASGISGDAADLPAPPADIPPDKIKKFCEIFTSKETELKKLYMVYSEKTPKSIFFLNNMMTENKLFKQDVMKLLERNGKLHLGCANFIFRPTQKIARYPLLFGTLQKRERPELKDAVREVVQCIEKINREMNTVVRSSSNYFELYVLYHFVRWNPNESYNMGILQKERTLLKKGNVVLRLDEGEPKEAVIAVLDNAVFFMVESKSSNAILQDLYMVGPPIPMEMVVVHKKTYTEEDEENGKFFMYIFNKVGERKIYLLKFEEKKQRDVYFNIIKEAVQKIEEILYRVSVRKFSVCPPEKSQIAGMLLDSHVLESGRSAAEEEGGGGREKAERGEDKETKEKPPAQKAGGPEKKRKQKSDEEMSIDPQYAKEYRTIEVSSEEGVKKRGLLMVNTGGIDYISCGKVETVYADKHIKKIVYHNELGVIFFLRKTSLFFSVLDFSGSTLKISPKKLYGSVENVFFGRIEQNECMAVKTLKTMFRADELLVITLTRNGDKIQTSLFRKMYVGSNINHLTFFGRQIVLACNDFEMININDLTTQELLDPLDQSIHVYLDTQKTNTSMIKKVWEDTYLVVFETIGFFIDKYGTRKKRDILFLWHGKCSSFHLTPEYVVAIGADVARIFTLKDGKLRGCVPIKNARAISVGDSIYLHDEKFVYQVEMGRTG